MNIQICKGQDIKHTQNLRLQFCCNYKVYRYFVNALTTKYLQLIELKQLDKISDILKSVSLMTLKPIIKLSNFECCVPNKCYLRNWVSIDIMLQYRKKGPLETNLFSKPNGGNQTNYMVEPERNNTNI